MLRTKNITTKLTFVRFLVDYQTGLGRTSLPETLNSLLKEALSGASVPKPESAPATLEILRIGANLCMDHGECNQHPLSLCV